MSKLRKSSKKTQSEHQEKSIGKTNQYLAHNNATKSTQKCYFVTTPKPIIGLKYSILKCRLLIEYYIK